MNPAKRSQVLWRARSNVLADQDEAIKLLEYESVDSLTLRLLQNKRVYSLLLLICYDQISKLKNAMK